MAHAAAAQFVKNMLFFHNKYYSSLIWAGSRTDQPGTGFLQIMNRSSAGGILVRQTEEDLTGLKREGIVP
jgi:hypothetical protein